MSEPFPDYYQILGIPKSASADDVRHAYKKESLKTHPDRLVNASVTEKRKATEKFQAVADAYYVLSDKERRREYDSMYGTYAPGEKTEDPNASTNFFSQFASMFAGAAGMGGGAQPAGARQPDPEATFTDVFDDLLRPEVDKRIPLWSYLGAVSGGGLGFIIANLPGLMVGAYAGNRLGGIRDAKGKSVAAVFNDLGANQKAEILRALAAKVLGSAFSS